MLKDRKAKISTLAGCRASGMQDTVCLVRILESDREGMLEITVAKERTESRFSSLRSSPG